MQIDFDNKNSLQEIISILLDGYVPTQLDYFDTGILAEAVQFCKDCDFELNGNEIFKQCVNVLDKYLKDNIVEEVKEKYRNWNLSKYDNALMKNIVDSLQYYENNIIDCIGNGTQESYMFINDELPDYILLPLKIIDKHTDIFSNLSKKYDIENDLDELLSYKSKKNDNIDINSKNDFEINKELIYMLNINIVKEFMKKIEDLTSQGHYREFETALLIAERSNLNHNEINQDLVDGVYNIASLSDELLSDYLIEELDEVFNTDVKEKTYIHQISSLDELKDFIEDLGWSIYDSDEQYWEIEQYSPAGEDFLFSICHNGDVEKAIIEIKDFCKYFDKDEHVTELLVAKQNGFQGVPSATELVADADSIQVMLEDLSYNLTKNVELVKDKEVEQDMEKD